ncbi:SAM-dependent methyltransferase [Streptomyces sp. 549]|uniref:SAM-dependent methyltransferase n=1 Tax=Streptomyces sp. 549 TaxID=3049076 RepID=UPI0024C36AA8|nr:SAM-dependent methyltransferase [Streptomyces sp. 549]MDK1471870.1 SAM-dependent methyltransferase [Streptomyces sp. 549]
MAEDRRNPDLDTALSKVDTTVPQSARIWNYWLGGKDNYEVDRAAGDQFSALYPDIEYVARVSRDFLGRAVRHLAGEVGVRQFLDIGTGLPTVENTHEIAQRVAPQARIVYADNDPMVLAHARALLTSTPEGLTRYIDSDLREPETILAAAREFLDFERPIALMLLNILGHIPDYEEARSIVSRLVEALPSGSYLVTADGTNVLDGSAFEAAIATWNDASDTPYHLRSPEQISRFLDGLELLEPGVVSCPLWRPDAPDVGTIRQVDEFGAVGRKP